VWSCDIQRNDIQHNDTQHNDTQHNDTQHNDTQHDDTQNNDTVIIVLVSVRIWPRYALCVNMLTVLQSVFMLNVAIPSGVAPKVLWIVSRNFFLLSNKKTF
jgi:hypothetical protein